MTLREYYQSLKYQPSPAATFVKEIASLCNRTEIAVRKWLAGDAAPDPYLQERIAAHLNIPADELFPKSMSNNKTRCYGNDRT